jgi:hypothetical protein
MRTFFILLTALSAGSACFGQKLPDFVVADTSGRYVHVYPAKFKKRILLVYFQPDCGECQAFADRMMGRTELLRGYQVVMVTNASVAAVKDFARTYRLGVMKGLIVGTEGWTNFLFRSLRVQRFPFVAVYDKRRLVRAFGDADELFKP